MDCIKLRAYATVANLSCGFDVLGLCLNNPFDEITIQKTDDRKVSINILDSPYKNIPSEPHKNTGGVPGQLIIKDLKLSYGFNISIKKGIPLCGGLGSSAATASGVVFGINHLLENKLSTKEMLKYAIEGEKVSVSTAHADNIAPCLLGGLTLIKDTKSLDVIKLSISEFYIVVIHPNIKISTEDARNILPEEISLRTAIKQCGELGSLIYAFSINDVSLIKKSMNDFIIEPIRKKLIKGFDEIKHNALSMGAVGCSISGSGPSIFALCETKEIAQKISNYSSEYYSSINLDCDTYISSINQNGPQIV